MQQPKKIIRKHYIVNKGIQFKYAGLLLLYLIVFFIISLAVIYFSGLNILLEKMANVYPQARLTEILNTVYLRLAFGFLLLLPIVAISAILLSHKIAGPLVRIKRALTQMVNNDYNVSIKLRKHDQLKDIANLINKLAENLKKKNV